MISSERAHDFVQRGARIRVHSGALGCHNLVMAEGQVIAYCPAPSLSIEHDDGSRSSWSVDLPIEEVPAPAGHPAIPDFMRLVGDEDGDVSLHCYRPSCDPHEHGAVAEYGYRLDGQRPGFASGQLGEFLAFVTEHAASHQAGEPR